MEDEQSQTRDLPWECSALLAEGQGGTREYGDVRELE
jgi:hypothetical protein